MPSRNTANATHAIAALTGFFFRGREHSSNGISGGNCDSSELNVKTLDFQHGVHVQLEQWANREDLLPTFCCYFYLFLASSGGVLAVVVVVVIAVIATCFYHAC